MLQEFNAGERHTGRSVYMECPHQNFITIERHISDVPSRIEQYAQQATIFREDDKAGTIYELQQGVVMLSKLLPDGRRQVVELVSEGSFFATTPDDAHDCTAEALTDCTVRLYDRHQAERSLEFQQHLVSCLRRQLQAARNHALLLGRKSALERVSSFLMRFIPNRGGRSCARATPGDDSKKISLNMSRQEIADYLGLTIETVSRSFSELKRQGLITITGNHHIQVRSVCKICHLTGQH